MSIHRPSFHSCDRCFGSEQVQCNFFWSELRNWLRPYVLNWIYNYGLPVWLGEEYDIADDILQDTILRLYKYLNQVDGNRPIESLENFSRTIAHNCVRDLYRRQYRLIRLTSLHETIESGDRHNPIDPELVALDQLTSQDMLVRLVSIIADLPRMQRRAILIDLAKYADFGEDACPLYRIFLEAGINLEEYRYYLPLDPIERNRHASLLSIAYKRLRRTFYAGAELVA